MQAPYGSDGNTEMRGFFWSPSGFLLLLIFGLNILLVYPAFFPNLSEMDMFDESIYVNSGKLLAEGTLPPYAGSPLVSLLFAIIYVPVHTLPFWLVHACGVGRFVLFCLLWISTYLIARQMCSLVHPLIMIGCSFVSPAIVSLLGNPSDALFSAMSGLAFWKFLSFYQSREISHLSSASAFVGLAALSRSDGLILGLILVFLALLLSLLLKRRLEINFKKCSMVLVSGLAPLGAIVGGYLLLYGFVTGSFELGIAKRSYLAFEQGQGVAYRHLYVNKNSFVEGQIEARRLFGSPEENQYSFINAIRRNPRPFFRRVEQIVKYVPKQIIEIYGHELGLLFFFLLGMGTFELIRKKMYMLLSIVLLWPLHLLVYFAFFFRGQYFLFPYFIVFILASVGLTSMVSNAGQRKDHYFWLAGLVVLAIIGLILSKAGLFATSVIVAMGFLLVNTVLTKYQNLNHIKKIGVMVILCIALILRGGFIPPEFRELGSASDEKAALFMREHLKPGARVGAYAPGKVWIAGMTYVPMYRHLRQFNGSAEFYAWIKNQKCEAIYLDDFLKRWEPSVYWLIQRQLGKNLRVAFSTEDRSVQVLLVDAID